MDKIVWTPRQINTLLVFSKHGMRMKDLKRAHQGTIGSLLLAGAIDAGGITAIGLDAIEAYNTGELSARAVSADLTERVLSLLTVGRRATKRRRRK